MNQKTKQKWIKRIKDYLQGRRKIHLKIPGTKKWRTIYHPRIEDFTNKELMRDFKFIKDPNYFNGCQCYYCGIFKESYIRKPIVKNIPQILNEIEL